MSQIAEATHEPQVAPGNTFGTTSTHSNPFTDSHAISSLTNVSVNDLTAVEMTTYEREATGEAAAVLKLEKKDASTQYVVTTFPTEIFRGDRADKASQSGAPGAAVAMSVHQEDGTSSHLVSTPSPSSRTNEDGKTWDRGKWGHEVFLGISLYSVTAQAPGEGGREGEW
ncbi:hypothetical protein BC827DRAFT_1384777 [Russula dissimulans]|nr:hypothetical protein BC827DRAFT_1384777 [Russula dissimulans]